jgi:hypothetical protein
MNILIFSDGSGNERFYMPIKGDFRQLLERLLELWPQVRLERVHQAQPSNA